MAKNPGKAFEADILSSIQSDVFVHRLRDAAQAYNNSKKTSFSWSNECDFFLFKAPVFLAIECKSTKYKSMSVQTDKDDDSSKMIKIHQIKSLRKISAYSGAYAGFLFNFRDEKNNCERTYYQSIECFDLMMKEINKKSFNELDLLTNGNAVKIDGTVKRTRYRWDMEKVFDNIMKNDVPMVVD